MSRDVDLFDCRAVVAFSPRSYYSPGLRSRGVVVELTVYGARYLLFLLGEVHLWTGSRLKLQTVQVPLYVPILQ